MAIILNLETATKTCSVALAKDGEVLAFKELTSEQFSHAEKLNGFIEEVLTQAKLKLKELDAVAVSEGPGSYTGLRIGTSTAKGLCYGLNIPLIAINSLQALAALVNSKVDFICPMFDARRLEVYTAVYDKELAQLEPTQALVIDENSFAAYQNKQVLFVGPGALKCQELLNQINWSFDGKDVSALGMVPLSEAKFNQGQFEDVAYFEPSYLKDFIAGPPKKLL
ncbi:MAG: tRNA (adenosine(37)-N6)-threonylcarbamoyltransferase complex dimerization subunit type 1 TsaB [Crocinitomicaceae bacterium]